MSEASASRHLDTLSERHRHLDKAIHVEEARPLPDNAIVRRLKAEKLRVKDAIASFTARLKASRK